MEGRNRDCCCALKRLTVASLIVRFMRSTWPLVQRVFGLVQAMVDGGDGAGVFEGMRAEKLLALDHFSDLGRAPYPLLSRLAKCPLTARSGGSTTCLE
jgi:hypothetical protein